MKLYSLCIILGSVLLTTVAQIALKIASGRYALENKHLNFIESLIAQILDPLTLTAIVAYIGSMVLWLLALRHLPLSIAYSFSGLTIALVTLSGVLILHESLSLPQISGIALILSGVMLLTRF